VSLVDFPHQRNKAIVALTGKQNIYVSKNLFLILTISRSLKGKTKTDYVSEQREQLV
jgi:hypothetical protein